MGCCLTLVVPASLLPGFPRSLRFISKWFPSSLQVHTGLFGGNFHVTQRCETSSGRSKNESPPSAGPARIETAWLVIASTHEAPVRAELVSTKPSALD